MLQRHLMASETFTVSLRDDNSFFYRRLPVSLSLPPPHTHLHLAEHILPLATLRIAAGLGRRELVLTTPRQILTIRPAPSHEHRWSNLLRLLRAPRSTSLRRYTLQAELGRGAFGVVHRAAMPDGPAVAIKRVSKKRLRSFPAALVAARRELSIAGSLPVHDNLVRVLEVKETPHAFFLVMECLSGGSLLDFVRTRRVGPVVVRAVMKQLLRAVAHMHACQVVHRDVKLENVLVADAGVEVPRVKVCDLGLAIEERALGTERATSAVVGTEYAQAPEMVLEAENVGGTDRYGRAVDVWACGIAMFTMLHRRAPWPGEAELRHSRMAEMMELSRRSLPSIQVMQTEEERAWIPEELQSLLCGLLQPDPARRLSARAALEHRALASYALPEELGPSSSMVERRYLKPQSLKQVAVRIIQIVRTVDCLHWQLGSRTTSHRAFVV